MICDKCGGRAYPIEEWVINGSIESWACSNCGKRGPILKDNRHLRGDIMSGKRGTCCECKKEDVLIVAKDRCWKCYDLIRPKQGRDPQRSNGPVIHIKPETTPVFVSDGANSAIATVPEKVTTADVVGVLEKVQSVMDDCEQINITFLKDDFPMLDLLKQNARKNRRSVENEILFILDNMFIPLEA